LTFNKATLKQIAEALDAEFSGDPETIATDVTHDSRQAGKGSLFVAIRGLTMDGHRFVEDVARRGAAGIISELPRPENFTGAWLQVADARAALAEAAAIVHGDPSHQLNLLGITGTNGKTTTTYLAFSLAEAAGEKAAMLTTVEYRIGAEATPAVRTTPEASDTQRFLRQAVDQGCKMAAMEASSQALHLHRCDGLKFRAAIFTNLTRDHLDYHHTMEEYFDAKKILFDGRLGSAPEISVINADDEWGVKLAEELKQNGQRVVTYGIDRAADFTAANIEISLIKGTSFVLKTPGGERALTSPLVGRPHVYNILAASAAALELGYEMDAVAKGIETCVGAPGRFERVPHNQDGHNGGDFAVVVDYAHTDDALLNTLKTARDLAAGKIITVFGCGGDRDKTKRAPMGAAAGKYSDLAIITSDNPRTEDPLKIIAEVEAAVKETGTPYLTIPDRREAINRAIAKAETGDVVIIAGKGHETYQIIGSDKFHFDDREVAKEALEARSEEK